MPRQPFSEPTASVRTCHRTCRWTTQNYEFVLYIRFLLSTPPIGTINACVKTHASLDKIDIWPKIKAARALTARKKTKPILDEEIPAHIHSLARTELVDVNE